MNPSSQEPSSEAERQQSAHATPLRGSVAELPASRPASCVDAEAGEEHEGDALADLPTCFPRGHYLAPRGFDRMLPTIRFSFHQELLEGPNSAAPTYKAVAPSEERLEDFNKVVDLLKSGEKDSVAAILSSSAETEQSLLDPSGPMLMLAIDERLPTLAMAILELMPSHCIMHRRKRPERPPRPCTSLLERACCTSCSRRHAWGRSRSEVKLRNAAASLLLQCSLRVLHRCP